MTVALVWYALPTAVLFCGEVADLTQTWVVWDFAVNGGECGDPIMIEVDGIRYIYPARDSGQFGHHCVMQLDGSCPPIAVDIPEHVWAGLGFGGLSVLGKAFNLTARAETMEYPEHPTPAPAWPHVPLPPRAWLPLW
jgi:hypothetical protein